jgi:hypothetical protein
VFGSLGLPELLVVVFVGALVVWPATRICKKAGYSPLLGIAIMIPGANIILLWFLALADWPKRNPGNE